MSANTNTETKPIRQPTLAAKYAKYIQFAFHVIEKVIAENPDIDGDVLRKSAHIFDAVSTQTEFVENFINNSKDISKQIKDIVSQNKKDAIKAAKDAIKAEKLAEKLAARDLLKTKKAKRSKTANIEDDLVSDLVSLATNTIPQDDIAISQEQPIENIAISQEQPIENIAQEPLQNDSKEDKKAAAKEAKDAEKKAAKEAKDAEKKAAKEAKDAEKKAAKEAKDAEKKTTKATEKKTTKATEPESSTTADNSKMLEVELDVRIFKFNDTSYLIDANSQLYHFETHHHIGHFDVQNECVVPL